MNKEEIHRSVAGLVVANGAGRIMANLGIGNDARIRSMVSDPDWIREALRKRIVPIQLTDTTLTGIATRIDDGVVVLLSKGLSDTVLNFVLNVDFAYDIIDHILTDPYDAMAIVDADERLAFISPVHEKFFKLRPGEGIGRHVAEIIENTRLPHVVRTGIAEVGQIQHMNGSERIVSRHPIRHDGRIVGAIGRVMFKGPQQVEALAKRVKALEQEIAAYRSESGEKVAGESFLDAIIGQSFAIRSVREQIRKIAPLDIPVLVQGESGTGKELVAQALHMMSPRRGGRLVTVNAAALPASLVESELFGYEPGSFTGADRKGRAGKFELADKGTIFLDEIGDMPIEVQSKLLRVLQDRMVERVGGEKPKRVDFRLCSATNRDLDQFIEEGRFRLDLFYRISPVQIVLPTLEERVEDIPLLLLHFVNDLARQYGRAVPTVQREVTDYLMERSWPGNVRQLRHVVERALVFSEGDSFKLSDFLRDNGTAVARGVAAAGPAEREPPTSGEGTLKDTLDQLENKLINDAVIRFQGNKKKAAEHLGISRSYLYKKLEGMG